MPEPLSDSAVMRAVARGGLLSAEQICDALAQAGERPLRDVVGEMGVSEETLLAQISQARVDTRVAPSDRIPPEAPSGKSFGKYELLDRLGRGGMGEVWRARQADLGREVALKLLLQVGEEERARFRREAQLAASLAHPNIAQIYEVGEAEGRPYLAMQLIAGQTLAAMRLPVRRALEAMRDAAEAVHHAHERGIVHRDLKPQNFMVDGEGKLYVMDFGLARGARDGSGAGTLTMSGEILGTPAYMAPEQALGNNHLVGARTDVWGLGATLYELVTGQAPYDGANAHEILAKIAREDPAPPRRLAPRVDRDVETVVLKCLQRDPWRRYETAADLAADLGRALRGEPIRARRAGAWERAWRGVARHPAIAAAAAVLALAATAALFLMPGESAPTVEELRARWYDAWFAGDTAEGQRILDQIRTADSAEARRLESAKKTFEEAEKAGRRREAGEFSQLGDQAAGVSRDHALALFAMAVGLDPRDRHARDALARLLPPGPATERLLGPAPGEARVDLTLEPAGAAVEMWPEGTLPIVKPGLITFRARFEGREAWLTATFAGGSWAKIEVGLPAKNREDCHFVSNGHGGGVFLSVPVVTQEEWRAYLASKGRPPGEARRDMRAWVSWDEAKEYAAARGARLPTVEEAARAVGVWSRAGGGQANDGYWAVGDGGSGVSVGRPTSGKSAEVAGGALLRLAWDP